jgi:hypothetical protein
MFTTRGLKASMTFLEETRIAMHAWLRGSKDLECDQRWSHANDEDEEIERLTGRRRGERAEEVEREAEGRRRE